MWNVFFCVCSTQINFSLEKTTINSIKKHQRSRRQKLGSGLAKGCGDSDSDGGCGRGWGGGCRCGGGQGNGQCKATSSEVEAKTQQSTIKKQKYGRDNGRSGVVAISRGRQCGDGCGGGQGNGGGRRGVGAAGRRRRLQRQLLRSAAVIVQCYRGPSQHRQNLQQYQPKQ